MVKKMFILKNTGQMHYTQARIHRLINDFRLITLLLIQLGFLTSAVSSKYNPNRRHYTENFDPSEADPKRNISCVGTSYDLKLPLLNGSNPNGVSMQTLCAKPQYGGGEPWQNAGGYCYYPNEPRASSSAYGNTRVNPDYNMDGYAYDEPQAGLPQTLQWMLKGKIVFDNHPGAKPSRTLQNPRVLQACLYRCFCNYGIQDVSIQPQTDLTPIRTWPSNHGYQLQIDVNDDFTVPFDQKKGQAALGGVDSTPIHRKPQIDRQGPGWLARPSYMSLDPGNEITCTGDLPSFILPSPYTRNTFSSVQEMCAVALSGGNKDVNAGGYCHRSASGPSSSPDVESTVWFSDSMTPRLDWSWGGNNFYAAASIRFHCWRHCTCKNNPPKNKDSSNLWKFMSSLQLGLQSDGSVTLNPTGKQPQLQQKEQGQSRDQGASSSDGTKQQVLPRQPPGATDSPSGTCGPNHNEFCPKQWDTASWGPIPREPPNVTDIVTPSPPRAGVMGVCGNRCSKQQDCAAGNDQYSCRCAFPSDSDARVLGLDPVAPVAVCIALFMTAGSGKAYLGGRDVASGVDAGNGKPVSWLG